MRIRGVQIVPKLKYKLDNEGVSEKFPQHFQKKNRIVKLKEMIKLDRKIIEEYNKKILQQEQELEILEELYRQEEIAKK